MELKSALSDYTQAEFLGVVRKIWAVDLGQADHDRLVAHFDSVVGHPKGADLIFYPDDSGNGVDVRSPEAVLHLVRHWHHRQGRRAFKDEPAPAPVTAVTTPPVRLSAKESALKRSRQKLDSAQVLAGEITSVDQRAEAALTRYQDALTQMHDYLATTRQESATVQLSQLLADVAKLEVARHQADGGVYQLKFLKMRVDFARRGAQSDLSSAFLDRPLQEQVKQLAEASHARYGGLLAAREQSQRELHKRSLTIFERAQERLVRLRALSGQEAVKKMPVLFRAPLADAAARPALLLSGEPMDTRAHLEGLKHALRSAVAEFSWRITTAHEEHLGQSAGLLSFNFNRLGDDQRFGMSLALSELVPIEGRDWQGLAQARAEVYLSFRLGSATVASKPGSHFQGLREILELSQVYLTATNGGTLETHVRVRAVTWDAARGVYRFTSEDVAPMQVEWSAPPGLVDSPPSASLADSLNQPSRLGFLHASPVPTLQPLEALESLVFDDYILVFPEASGVPPLYVMFKDPRQCAGVVSGIGQAVSGPWLTGSMADEGARVPASIASQLRGRVFLRFELFVQAFWKAVAADGPLSASFSAANQTRMRAGQPPFADETGARDPYVLLHHQPIAQGGGVYDLDNLRIDY